MAKQLCIIQSVIKQYRVPFYKGLEKALSESDITLKVVYGTPWKEEAERRDNADLSPPLGHKVPTYRLFRKLLVQPSLFPWLRADLVVLEPANKHALNYLLMALQALRIKNIAFWGHGYDRQTDEATLGNRFKRKALHWSKWWFAYTRGAADYLEKEGFDARNLTVVENAIDTAALRGQLAQVKPEEIERVCNKLGWSRENRIAVYCGSLYENKKLHFLFKSAEHIYLNNPGFRLLIIGGGPMEDEVRAFAEQHEWVCYVGAVFEREKALFLKMADLWLSPGVVGLGVLDAFCAGLPAITTDLSSHGPEIEYLQHNHNGLIVAPDEMLYGEAVLGLIGDDEALSRLGSGALAAAERYTIETMVDNFATGVRKCLHSSK